MQEKGWIGHEPLTLAHDQPVGEPPRRGFGVALAAAVALVSSAGLAWWVAAPNPAADVSAAPPQDGARTATAAQAPPPLRYAAVEPDPAQVRQALADVQQGYADGGAEALVQASAACARELSADPRRLDYCLAYDVYAAQVVPPGAGPAAADWFKDARDRDLALARAALPASVDAANRLAQVGELTRAVLPNTAVRPKPPAVVQARQVGKPAAAKPKAVKAKAAKAAKAKSSRVKVATARSSRPWTPPEPSTLDEQYARAAAAEAELDRQISEGLIDPPH
jgi:hypothetical protein